MIMAKLINRATGQSVQVHATTDHVDSHYGLPVWVDDGDIAYCQVGLEYLWFTIEDDDER